MATVVRLAPPQKMKCGRYDLDAFVIELEEGVLDFRFEVGSGYDILWALPAPGAGRLRLFLVKNVAYEVEEPELCSDPFVFDFPLTTWQGELGALGELPDRSFVTAVTIEISSSPLRYRCVVTRRMPDGKTEVRTFAWAPN